MSFDLDAYLARIGLPARVTVDAEGLGRLQRAHRQSIPFENLDVALGRPIRIDGDAVFAKLVGARRGGYCFEQNRLFGDALRALGFGHHPVLARVWLGVEPGPGSGGDAVPPLTHTLSIVMLDGQPWIADPGFGGSYTPPLPLVDGVTVGAPDGAEFRLERDGEGWMLWRLGDPAFTDGRGTGGGWQRQYGFTTARAFDADLAMGNHWSATAPASRFVQHRIVSIVLPHGFASLTDRSYRRRVGTETAEAEITDPRVYRMRLGLMFGIDLPREDTDRLFAEG